jgi:HPt (histidine-containing phosphotransfer) domain-containing protein
MGRIDELRALQRPGKPDLLKKVITQYLADGVTLVATIRGGLTAGDAAAVQGACHRFKSSSAFVGATWLAQLCEELDRDCRDGRLPLDTDSLPGIEEGFREARSGLEQLLLEAAP